MEKPEEILTHATFVETLPPHHKDPFDRMLISQAPYSISMV